MRISTVFRKGRAKFLLLCLVLFVSNFAATGEAVTIDMDGDGLITYADEKIASLLRAGIITNADLPVKLGDVTGNGSLSSLDTSFISRHVSAIKAGTPSPLNSKQQALADLDGDGQVTYADTRISSMLVVGLVNYSNFPVKFGDVTGNGTLSSLDTSYISRHVAAIKAGTPSPLNSRQKALADLDGDGQVTYADVRVSSMLVVGLVNYKDFPVKFGDVTGNGTLSSLDTSYISRHVAAIKAGTPSPLSAKQQALADLDGDGQVTYADVRISSMLVVGLVNYTDFPVKLGDVYMDGKWDARDTILIQRHIESVKNGKASPLTRKQQFLADIDGDGMVTEVDAQISRMLIAVSIKYSDIETYVRIAQFAELVKDRATDVNGDKQVDQLDIAVVSEGYSLVLENLKMIEGGSLAAVFDANGDGYLSGADREWYVRSIKYHIETYARIAEFAELVKDRATDVNGDKQVDELDIAIVSEGYSLVLENLKMIEGGSLALVFDVNQDGVLNTADAVRYVVSIKTYIRTREKIARYAALLRSGSEDVNGDGLVDEKDVEAVVSGYDLALNNLGMIAGTELELAFDWNKDGKLTEADAIGYRRSIQTFIETRANIERFAETLRNAQEDKDNDGVLDPAGYRIVVGAREFSVSRGGSGEYIFDDGNNSVYISDPSTRQVVIDGMSYMITEETFRQPQRIVLDSGTGMYTGTWVESEDLNGNGILDFDADVNRDGQVDEKDVEAVVSGYDLALNNLGMIAGTELEIALDWNRDGMLTQDDAVGCSISIQTFIERTVIETREKIERFGEKLRNAQEDKDNDGNLDIDEQALASAAFSTWTANGVFDVDNDGTMSTVNEDVNGNGKLDGALDINGDGRIDDMDHREVMDSEGYELVLNNLNLLNEEEIALFDQNRDGIVNYDDASFVADNIRAHFSGNDTGSGEINKRAMITRKMLSEMASKNGIFTAKQPLDEATLSPKIDVKMKEPVR
ncbi:MAG: hypothetical protein HQL30_12375 [Candidatus Omnitrophica bacterium]|nr:hypothetical protein [Candidatus Omnitrophota bacterium]